MTLLHYHHSPLILHPTHHPVCSSLLLSTSMREDTMRLLLRVTLEKIELYGVTYNMRQEDEGTL